MRPFKVDRMACTASVLQSPFTGGALPFFSPYDCAGSAGTNVFAQDVSFVPDTYSPAFEFCLPPPITAGHTFQHMAESKAHAVALLPDVKAYWFPLLQLATFRSVEVAPAEADGRFQWRSAEGGLRNWQYPR